MVFANSGNFCAGLRGASWTGICSPTFLNSSASVAPHILILLSTRNRSSNMASSILLLFQSAIVEVCKTNENCIFSGIIRGRIRVKISRIALNGLTQPTLTAHVVRPQAPRITTAPACLLCGRGRQREKCARKSRECSWEIFTRRLLSFLFYAKVSSRAATGGGRWWA